MMFIISHMLNCLHCIFALLLVMSVFSLHWLSLCSLNSLWLPHDFVSLMSFPQNLHILLTIQCSGSHSSSCGWHHAHHGDPLSGSFTPDCHGSFINLPAFSFQFVSGNGFTVAPVGKISQTPFILLPLTLFYIICLHCCITEVACALISNKWVKKAWHGRENPPIKN